MGLVRAHLVNFMLQLITPLESPLRVIISFLLATPDMSWNLVMK